MKSHTEAIKEELDILDTEFHAQDRRNIQDIISDIEKAKAQLKEAERHDRIITKIKAEVNFLSLDAEDINDFLEEINKIDQETQ